MTASPPSSIRRDIASGYLASAAKVGSWVVVCALVYRLLGAEAFALLALVRATIGILNYTSLGLAPAMVNLVAAARGQAQPTTALPPVDPVHRVYANGIALALIYGAGGFLLAFAYAIAFPRLLNVPAGYLQSAPAFVALMGAGAVLRLMADPAGAAVQAMGRIDLDNLLIAAAEILWAGLCALLLLHPARNLNHVAQAYVYSGLFCVLARYVAAGALTGMLRPKLSLASALVLRQFFVFGAMVVLSQLADYLYAPADYILINKLIDPKAVATYAPALQIDSGLLLLVSAVAAVLLPRAALAHAAGESHTVRAYYVRGTLACLFVLAVAALAVYLASPWIFWVWLKDPMRPTQAILPLVLIHTVIGGSSGVGRSILLATGRTRALAISALVAGVGNVVMGFAFVRFGGMGLRGIVLATIIAVSARCVGWMPWYVMRATRLTGLQSAPTAQGTYFPTA